MRLPPSLIRLPAIQTALEWFPTSIRTDFRISSNRGYHFLTGGAQCKFFFTLTADNLFFDHLTRRSSPFPFLVGYWRIAYLVATRPLMARITYLRTRRWFPNFRISSPSGSRSSSRPLTDGWSQPAFPFLVGYPGMIYLVAPPPLLARMSDLRTRGRSPHFGVSSRSGSRPFTDGIVVSAAFPVSQHPPLRLFENGRRCSPSLGAKVLPTHTPPVSSLSDFFALGFSLLNLWSEFFFTMTAAKLFFVGRLRKSSFVDQLTRRSPPFMFLDIRLALSLSAIREWPDSSLTRAYAADLLKTS
ncbi:hypothetical protein PGT21_021430 [Puccinia graminis f. sp. tritici]|uniref:Uncharacterized protein n=1 Tax=Puccinia graminis f. sp. tritici TaxID=56615 RepID=A0A5B0P770_PUCGR|nr:hypothetical protein PGT21_021430 [Puccinia graminis f. sp. tritici]KAA1131855.1 hypothetical protein PGTUg99_030583 [Puccinia graminis f. sp. tritici]